MSRIIDLTGQKFGRLTVIERGPDYVKPSGKHEIKWHCRCECGNEIDVLGENLKRGVSRSCGCYRKETTRSRTATHGESNTRLYGIWLSMKRRCYLPSDHAYADYGGRGIHVCPECVASFEEFRDWSYSHGYTEDLSIDRIDNDGNYEPNNCRWVDCVAQANNRRSNHVLTFRGETHNVTQWAAILGKNPKTIFTRLYVGWPVEKALTT